MSIWTNTEALVNRAIVRAFPTTVTYTDRAGHSDTFEAVFDELYEMVETNADGVQIPLQRPVITVQISDFVTSTPQERGRVVIGSRVFAVDAWQIIGHQDGRMILQEIV